MKKLKLAAVALLVIAAAGFIYSGFILKVQNGGVDVGTFSTYFVLNCSTGASCSRSGSTVTLTASGTAVRKSCDIVIGDASGSALTDAQLGPQVGLCYVPVSATILEVDVRADGGTPQIIVAKSHAGAVSNLVSSALATGGSGAIACANVAGGTGLDGVTTCSATLQNTAVVTGDYIQAVSGTAGGVAKLFTVHVIYQ